MITEVNNSFDMRKALNENLHGLLTGQRKPHVVKEVNNTLGKMLSDVKMEMMQNMLVGDRRPIRWFDKDVKPSLTEANGQKSSIEITSNETPKFQQLNS